MDVITPLSSSPHSCLLDVKSPLYPNGARWCVEIAPSRLEERGQRSQERPRPSKFTVALQLKGPFQLGNLNLGKKKSFFAFYFELESCLYISPRIETNVSTSVGRVSYF